MNIFKCLICDNIFAKSYEYANSLCRECGPAEETKNERDAAHAYLASRWAAAEANQRARRQPGRPTDEEWAKQQAELKANKG
jgi:phosphopantetheinyl transferase (holo-ACP synthase)